MKFGVLILVGVLFFSLSLSPPPPSKSFALEGVSKALISQNIDEIDLEIQNASSSDYEKLSELFASRGEDYLIAGEDLKALDDFQMSYENALKCQEDTQPILSFRSLFGAFLIYARLEGFERVCSIYRELQSTLDSFTCHDCQEPTSRLQRRNFQEQTFQITSCNNQPDWPILGPDKISIQECLDRVYTTTRAIRLLMTAVRRTEIRVLAIALIDQLEESANRCCRSGGLWKGCLQKLVNKLHYWRALGVPADPMWD